MSDSPQTFLTPPNSLEELPQWQAAILIAGSRGAGKSTAGEILRDVGEIVDAEQLQYLAASAIAPDSPENERYQWEFWTKDRLDRLPAELNRIFVDLYGPSAKATPYVVLVAAVLVKDWFLRPLKAVLEVHRPRLVWPKDNYLILDFNPAEILRRIRRRDRASERLLSLADVEVESRGYRECHARKSEFPWQFLLDDAALDAEMLRLRNIRSS